MTNRVTSPWGLAVPEPGACSRLWGQVTGSLQWEVRGCRVPSISRGQMQRYSSVMAHGDEGLQPRHVESVHMFPKSTKWQPGDQGTGWELGCCADSWLASC